MIKEFILYFSIAFILFCLITYYSASLSEIVFVKSTVDGNEYMVRNLPDKEQAANILAELRQRMEKLIDYVVKEKSAQDEFCEAQINQLKSRFRADKIAESPADSKATSYSVDKSRVFLCIRDKSDNSFVDVNTLFFTGAHELAHIMTTEIGHTGQFWSNFKYLLRCAITLGVYKYQDFATKPAPFCSIMISSTPFDPITDKLDLKSPNQFKSCR